MGRKSVSGGVTNNRGRCQIVFYYQGKRYRPTLPLTYTKSNAAAAARIKADIDRRISNGAFDFAAEFPEFQNLAKVPGVVPKVVPTFRVVGEDYLASLEGLADITKRGYANILRNFWFEKIGERPIDEIRYSELKKIMANEPWGADKTRNNKLSVLCQVFGLAMADELIERNPTALLESVKVQRDPPDPFSLNEAETIIAAIRRDHGDRLADYFEWQFFTGCRPSETIALKWANVDLQKRRVRILAARVAGKDKAKTKTAKSRDIDLCPRAYAVLQRQRAVSQLKGKEVFLRDDGARWTDLQLQLKRWDATLERLDVRRRPPYQTRHTSVSWNLMLGKNIVWVARQHGHSVAMTTETYGTWLEGAGDDEVARIRAAMESVERAIAIDLPPEVRKSG